MDLFTLFGSLALLLVLLLYVGRPLLAAADDPHLSLIHI